MRSWIDHSGEVVWEPAPSLVAQLVEAGQPFWLDIENPTDEVIDQLATRLGLHPLAVENSKQFGQRAKLQVYGNVAVLVGFGLDQQLREPVEVHCYYTTGFLVTLRRAPSPALDALRQAGSVQPQLGSDPIRVLHPLVSSLYTQFSALALELDQRLDVLEQRVLREADDQPPQLEVSEPIRDPQGDHLLTPHNCALVIIDYRPTQVTSKTPNSSRRSGRPTTAS
jgi:magnesium transporter